MKKIFTLLLIMTLYLVADTNQTQKWSLNPIKYDKNSTCLVRNLPIYKSPKWVAKIETKGGKSLYFCSPKSMFEFYFEPIKWDTDSKDIKKIFVTDYSSLKPIDAKTAFYVYGSRVISQAGDDLVAFASKGEAEEFVKLNGGARVFSFDQISKALIRLLNGRI